MKNVKLICCFVFFGVLANVSVFLGAFHALSFYGFALDSQNLLYVGRDNVIEVYKGNEKVFDINPKTSRAYAFTINDDIIVLSTSEFVYKIDLSGNVIEKSEDVYSKTYTNIGKSKKHFYTENNEYSFKNNFGRYKIVDKNGYVLYEMTGKEFAIKSLFTVSFFMELLIIFAFVIKNDIPKYIKDKLKSL